MLSGYGGGESDTATVNDIKNTILSNAKDGRVMLLNCQAKTVQALDSALYELTTRGYEFVTVSDLFGGTDKIPLGYQVKEVQ